MTLRLLTAGLLASAALVATPVAAAPTCPRLVDTVGDSSYGLLGKGSTDLDIAEVQVASGPKTVEVAVRLATVGGSDPELRIGSRVDARISLAPVDYFFAARRGLDGSWRFTMTAVRIGPDGRPTEIPERSVEGRIDAVAAEVVFVARRADFVEKVDGRVIRLVSSQTFVGADVSVQEADRVEGAVDYRDRGRACRRAS
ncbi:MAG TPA: hypothetical protein VNA14_02905 [Mycobacteriales bacterium]|nr:hypothetical protein [Mycobacteriales bacterium]